MRDGLSEEIREIEAAIGPRLREKAHDAAMFALLRLAAHHALHDEAKRADFIATAEAAWTSSEKIHAKCKGR